MIHPMENVPLSGYSTMRLGGKARYLTEVSTREQVAEAWLWAKSQNLPVIMIGYGSNIVWGDKGYNGLVLVNRIMKFEIFMEDDDNAYITVGAGENWDSVVERIVALNYSGVEELSLIPGTAGATPVQNVGAYGREISESLTTIEAYDTKEEKLITLRASDCSFSYRSSRFKTTDKGRFFITSVTLHVTHQPPKQPFYPSVSEYFSKHNISSGFTPKLVREAVIDIRSNKLPNPNLVANNGSFFQNPIVDKQTYQSLIQDFPNITSWKGLDDKVKLSAAWLIEQSGFKDVHDQQTGIGTWPKQPLVLINEHANSTADLLAFKQKIVSAVQTKFGVELLQEPEFIES